LHFTVFAVALRMMASEAVPVEIATSRETPELSTHHARLRLVTSCTATANDVEPGGVWSDTEPLGPESARAAASARWMTACEQSAVDEEVQTVALGFVTLSEFPVRHPASPL
jgi:hypothetical protein